MREIKLIAFGILFGLISTAIILLVSSPSRKEPVTLLPSPTPAHLVVHIDGAVLNPGVYSLLKGSRVQDVITLAGGLVSSADSSAVNLAAVLYDGQKVLIPTITERSLEPIAKSQEITISPENKLDINSATLEQLILLPGIGPTKAESIINYRQEHGPFDTIEELLNVEGIGPAIFEGLMDLITIQGSP